VRSMLSKHVDLYQECAAFSPSKRVSLHRPISSFLRVSTSPAHIRIDGSKPAPSQISESPHCKRSVTMRPLTGLPPPTKQPLLWARKILLSDLWETWDGHFLNLAISKRPWNSSSKRKNAHQLSATFTSSWPGLRPPEMPITKWEICRVRPDPTVMP